MYSANKFELTENLLMYIPMPQVDTYKSVETRRSREQKAATSIAGRRIRAWPRSLPSASISGFVHHSNLISFGAKSSGLRACLGLASHHLNAQKKSLAALT